MNEEVDLSKEELSVSLESPSADGSDGNPLGVAPAVLVAVVLGVVCIAVLLFSMAFFMDRRKSGSAKPDRSSRGSSSQRSTKVTILDDMCPDPMSDPPAAASASTDVSLPGTSSEC
ncbi:uncharacterized protein LOC117645365 [Thrips palmi]|uniref:Uncharacterized protein LOC117645365 n=1 Tax=Thrips palmi TaxID=161013 RepID=A0A6P8YV47_THRPL|nr:uncharacterized protein LOC117645365 [Thrips palmi]